MIINQPSISAGNPWAWRVGKTTATQNLTCLGNSTRWFTPVIAEWFWHSSKLSDAKNNWFLKVGRYTVEWLWMMEVWNTIPLFAWYIKYKIYIIGVDTFICLFNVFWSLIWPCLTHSAFSGCTSWVQKHSCSNLSLLQLWCWPTQPHPTTVPGCEWSHYSTRAILCLDVSKLRFFTEMMMTGWYLFTLHLL